MTGCFNTFCIGHQYTFIVFNLIGFIFLQLKLLAKSRYSLARFKGEQIVIVSQVSLQMRCYYLVCFNYSGKFSVLIKSLFYWRRIISHCQDSCFIEKFNELLAYLSTALPWLFSFYWQVLANEVNFGYEEMSNQQARYL
jgi:hypothetical protein